MRVDPMSVCSSCAHLESEENVGFKCKAYPNRIPKDLLNGFDDKGKPVTHDKPRKDQDNKIVFLDVVDKYLGKKVVS